MGKLITRLLVLTAILLAAAMYQFNQVSKVQDPDLIRRAQQALSDDFHSKTLGDISESLQGDGSPEVIADQAGSLITQDVTLTAIRAARTLLPWRQSATVVLQLDFVLEENGAKVLAGRRYLRFAPTIDHGWRYLGETDFKGFYKNLL